MRATLLTAALCGALACSIGDVSAPVSPYVLLDPVLDSLIVGDDNGYSSVGGIVAGYGNLISGLYASASGGFGNTASGSFSSVSGGFMVDVPDAAPPNGLVGEQGRRGSRVCGLRGAA